MPPHDREPAVTVKQFDIVQSPPTEALEALDRQIAAAGGEWHEPPEYEGAVGRTMFDTPASADGTVTILLPKEQIANLPGQSLVRIKSVADGRSYLGVVVQGPFAEPDGLRADAPILVAVSVRGGILMPKYHGRAQVELLGEEVDDGGIVPPRRRPLPNSPVFLLSAGEAARVLRTSGELRLGVVDGHEDVEVRVPAHDKAVLPRHIGILGTTGGGKSTTVSGLVAQLQHAGVAVVLIDTEGEYAALGEPTTDPAMCRALARRGREPAGVPDTRLYHLVGRRPANPNHPSLHPFALRFDRLSPYALMEILDLNEPQQTRFLKAYDATKLALDKLKICPANSEEREKLLDIDEFETGYPRMTLLHLYDMVKLIAAHVAKDENDPFLETPAFHQGRDLLKQAVEQADVPGSLPSWRALQGRLGLLKRLNIFDQRDLVLDYKEMLRPGRVSVLDLSDIDSVQVNNLVIAQLLRGLQRQQDVNYRAATRAERPPTPALILIEEAHEFLSAERIKQMPVLFQQVARIARRGRKRWLGLGFISQLPQHLPDEVLGLINNWVLHKINDSQVVSRLRRSVGGIDDALWSRLPNLAPGQAIVSFTNLARPLLTAIDPTPCRLLMVE